MIHEEWTCATLVVSDSLMLLIAKIGLHCMLFEECKNLTLYRQKEALLLLLHGDLSRFTRIGKKQAE